MALNFSDLHQTSHINTMEYDFHLFRPWVPGFNWLKQPDEKSTTDNILINCIPLVLGWRECWPDYWPKTPLIPLTVLGITISQVVFWLIWF